jgi:hypothetical protein
MAPPAEHPAGSAQRQALGDGERIPGRRERAGLLEIVDDVGLQHSRPPMIARATAAFRR